MKELKLKAYVDGSFNVGTSRYGAGVVMLSMDEKVLKTVSVGGNDGSWVAMRNVAGEVYAAMLAVKTAIEMEATELTIYHDYEGISHWVNRQWRAKNPATSAYVMFMDKAAQSLKIQFCHVKGHSGSTFNNMADELAKNGTKGV